MNRKSIATTKPFGPTSSRSFVQAKRPRREATREELAVMEKKLRPLIKDKDKKTKSQSTISCNCPREGDSNSYVNFNSMNNKDTATKEETGGTGRLRKVKVIKKLKPKTTPEQPVIQPLININHIQNVFKTYLENQLESFTDEIKMLLQPDYSEVPFAPMPSPATSSRGDLSSSRTSHKMLDDIQEVCEAMADAPCRDGSGQRSAALIESKLETINTEMTALICRNMESAISRCDQPQQLEQLHELQQLQQHQIQQVQQQQIQQPHLQQQQQQQQQQQLQQQQQVHQQQQQQQKRKSQKQLEKLEKQQEKIEKLEKHHEKLEKQLQQQQLKQKQAKEQKRERDSNCIHALDDSLLTADLDITTDRNLAKTMEGHMATKTLECNLVKTIEGTLAQQTEEEDACLIPTLNVVTKLTKILERIEKVLKEEYGDYANIQSNLRLTPQGTAMECSSN